MGNRGEGPSRLHTRSRLIRCLLSTLFIALFLTVAIIIIPPFFRARPLMHETFCRSYHLDPIALSIRMYATDNDQRLPLRTSWCEAVLEQSPGSPDLLRCPAVPTSQWGYAYNAALSGGEVTGLPQTRPPDQVIMVFDGLGGWNASGGPEAVDPDRHRGGYNAAFADGHFKRLEWVNPSSFDVASE